METLEVKKITENSINVLQEETLYTLKQINNFVHHNDYNFTEYPFNKYNHKEVELAIMKLSLNQRKKLKRKINHFRFKQSLKSANLFIHFFFKKITKSDIKISINYPEKQLEIMKKRKKYIKALNEMKILYNDYKQEKGNYFKLRLKNNQKI